MKILIAIPCMQTVLVDFVESLMVMDKPEQTDIHFWQGSLVHDARNMLTIKAVTDGYDYVMWMDSDMVFPTNTLTRLLQVAQENNVGMVSGLYVKRTFPTLPVIYDKLAPPTVDDNGKPVKNIHEYVDYPVNSVFPIAGCGFGCVLTSVSLLKKVWEHNNIPAFTPLPWAGEDIAFCIRTNETGERILCDSSVSCGHLGTFCYNEKMLKRGDVN